MRFKFFVSGQEMTQSMPKVIVSDTVNYFDAEFRFNGTEWEDCVKTAHFQLGDEIYDFPIDEFNCISEDKGINLFPGKWIIYVHGDRFVDGQLAQRITTNSCTFVVQKSGVMSGDPYPSIPQGLATQLMAKMSEMEERVLPKGGEKGQVLAKKSSNDFDFTWVTPEGEGGGTTPAPVDPSEIIEPGGGLKVNENGKLVLDMAEEMEQDNTLPISSGEVYKQVGNIGVLLETI